MLKLNTLRRKVPVALVTVREDLGSSPKEEMGM